MAKKKDKPLDPFIHGDMSVSPELQPFLDKFRETLQYRWPTRPQVTSRFLMASYANSFTATWPERPTKEMAPSVNSDYEMCKAAFILKLALDEGIDAVVLWKLTY